MKPNMSSIGPKLAGIFEKYCQWMALSLGILWIMYTTYAYWVSKPVAVTVGSEILSPREVDDHVATSVALTKLHDQIDPKLTRIQPDITSVTRGNVPKYADIILENLSGTKIAGNFNPATSAGGVNQLNIGPITPVEDVKATLPPVPANVYASTGLTSGLMVIAQPEATVNPNIGAPAPKVVIGVAPGVPGDPAAAPVVPSLEISWVTYEVKINMAKLAESFKAARLTKDNGQTQILNVKLVREELLADGSWGSSTVITDMFPDPTQPAFPPKTADEGNFITWASQNFVPIINPVFFTALRGPAWRNFSTPEVVEAADAPPPFDPALVKPGDVSKLPPDQLKLYQEYVANKAKEDREKQKANRPPPTVGCLKHEAKSVHVRRGESRAAKARSLQPGVFSPLLPEHRYSENPLAPPAHHRHTSRAPRVLAPKRRSERNDIYPSLRRRDDPGPGATDHARR